MLSDDWFDPISPFQQRPHVGWDKIPENIEMFEQNVGLSDRAIRTLAGLFLLAMIFLAPDAPLRWFGLIGIVPLITGVVGTCPFYILMGKSTCPSKEKARARID
ncbi:MAG: YgaP family membrane protein [Rhizobiaceae bacterium]